MTDERPRITPCPHCGEAVEEAQSVCPNCGALLGGAWPPPPEGYAPLPPPLPQKALTGRVWTDFLLGAAGQYLAHLATAQALVHSSANPSNISDDVARFFAPGLFVLVEFFWAFVFGALGYFGLRRAYPIVARGSGYASLLLFAVLLGALVICRPLIY